MERLGKEEIDKSIGAIDPKTVAGSNGVKLKEILTIHVNSVTRLLTGAIPYIETGAIPYILTNSGTVLILKSGNKDDLRDIDNWRLITIKPILLRIFTKIMAKRLTEAVE
ncbi:hypothetical protein chiPu_0026645 [Chiloscyllium punctatum]|uniref:Uncharacterized protein n=1 Tax=Chiloscyllium punctatum TaxID=137246 RepID=A0A401TJ71_CHIPU|nr:hypothetical protein [Chiloscyllium punctatum]